MKNLNKGKVIIRPELIQREDKNGYFPIRIRISVDGIRKGVSTEFKVKSPSHFRSDKIGKWVVTDIDAKKINEGLKDLIAMYSECAKVVEEKSVLTADNIIAESRRKYSAKSFCGYMDMLVEDKKADSAGTFKRWSQSRKWLSKFLESQKKKDIYFVEVNVEFAKKIVAFMRKQKNTRENDKMLDLESIKTYLRPISTAINSAIKSNMDGIKTNPFKDMGFSLKNKPQQKYVLTKDDMSALIALDLKEGSLQWHCRYYFLFQFFTCGMRISDLIKLRWSNISESERTLTYAMAKNSKVGTMALSNDAWMVLEYYMQMKPNRKPTDFVFPLMDSRKWEKYATQKEMKKMSHELRMDLEKDVEAKTALVNKGLKEIGVKIGLQKLTTHMARHTFSNHAIVGGWNLRDLQGALRHSSTTTTEGYVRQVSESVLGQSIRNNYPLDGLVSDKPMSDKDSIDDAISRLSDEERKALIARLIASV